MPVTEDRPEWRKDALEAARKLAAAPLVKGALESIRLEADERIKDQVELTEIPSPPFHEDARAAHFAEMLKALGVPGVHRDEIGNVIGRFQGENPNGPVLVMGAHLDTVFPDGTDCSVRKEGSVYYGAGISDDAGGLASLLQVCRTIAEKKIPLLGDLVVVGTLGEEGNGDLRGAKALFNAPNDYDAFVALDSAAPTRILKGSVGCKRYRVTFTGPGGHSLHRFGISGSAVHALCRAGTMIDDLEPPKDPKTTFNIGVIKGGTSVNAIAAEASFELDVRSYDQPGLVAFVEKVLAVIKEAVKLENERWRLAPENAVSVRIDQIGDRPAGINAEDSPVTHSAFAAMTELGIPLLKYGFAATDQNAALAKGLPATTLGAGGLEGFNHSTKEWWDATDAHLGPQLAFLTALVLLGVKGVADPILAAAHKN